MTCINAENTDINNKPTIAVVIVVDGGFQLLVMDFQGRIPKVNIIIHDANKEDINKLP